MPDSNLIDPADTIERQNEKLRKIVRSLMMRVERDTDQTGNAFSLFQRAIALEGEVRARTRDLQRTLDELNRVNSELEAASAVAEEANRAKSRFVAAASHDVRQPLNAAKLFLASLADTGPDERQRKILDQLGSSLDSVESLIGSLLEISRLDSSSIRADVSRFPCWSVLGPLVDEFGPVARERGVELRHVQSSYWVESDPYYFRQILQNVLANAIQYSPEGGTVLLGCRRRGGGVEIQVADSGPGIAEADIPVIFEEFKRLRHDAGQGRVDKGVGLGLAIVKRACGLLRHPFRLDSELGRGTTFTVTVPPCPPIPGSEFTATGGVAESAEALVVLLVSRDAELVADVSSLLDQWDAGAIIATSLDDAETKIEQLGMNPDAFLLDVDADADKDGESTARFLNMSAVSALIVSGDCEGRGSVAWSDVLPRLTKPVQPHRLRAILHRGGAKSG